MTHPSASDGRDKERNSGGENSERWRSGQGVSQAEGWSKEGLKEDRLVKVGTSGEAGVEVE